LNRRLLDAIAAGDWETYASLCDPGLTCFEPEARGERVEGLAFHRFYFDERRAAAGRAGGGDQVTMIAPEVRRLGSDAAVVTYVRLVQHRDASGNTATSRSEETRVWQRREDRWRLVHLHRSAHP